MTALDFSITDPTPAPGTPTPKQPGQWRRRGPDGPPMVTSPNPDDVVKSGERKGLPYLLTYGRPSGRGKLIENSHALQKWGERMAIFGVVLDPELVLQVGRIPHDVDSDEWKRAMDQLVKQAKERANANLAAERGQHAHSITEDTDEDRSWIDRALAGEELGISTAAQAALVEAWQRMLRFHGFEILAVEAPVVCDSLRLAGTLDRIVRLTRDITFITLTGERVTLPAGTVLILDIKSGRLRTDRQGRIQYWHSYAIQLAAYALGVPYDVDTETRGEWPFEVSTRWAIIAHLDVLGAITDGEARCRLVLCDLERGVRAAMLCAEATDWANDDEVFTVPDMNPEMLIAVPVEQPAEPERTPVKILRHRVGLLAREDQERLWYAWQAAGLPSIAEGQPEPSPSELVAIMALVAEHEPFDNVVTLPVTRTPAPEPVVRPAAPTIAIDEGSDVTVEAVEFLNRRRGRLTAEQTAWWMDRAQEASEAGRSIALVEARTERRYWVALGLVTLAEHDSLDDDCVRALLASVLNDPTAYLPIVPVGRGLGFLDATSAPKFAQLADDLIAGLVAAVVDPDDGTTRITKAEQQP